MLDFKAAIFDLDGTLIDSIGVWEKIDHAFLKKRHLPVPKNYVRDLSSMGHKEAAEYTVSLFHLKESAEEVLAEWKDMAIDEYSNHIRLKPNAKEYLLFLKAQGIKLGVATSLPEALYVPVLQNNGIYRLFDAFSSTQEVSRGKEYPDVYLLTAKKLGVPPRDCVVFEDILPAIRGALLSGMRPYGVYDPYSEHQLGRIMQLSTAFIFDFSQMMPPKWAE